MKKLMFVLLALLLSAALLGCNQGEKVQNIEQPEKKSTAKNERNEQEFIIMESINDPLPPEAENVQSMPNKGVPQQIPKANLKDPIIITKMPYSEKNRP